MTKRQASALDADLAGLSAGVRDRVRIFRVLLLLSGQLRARMDGRYREEGITTQQAAVLALVVASNEPPSQSEVARALGVTHQNVRQLARSLEIKGFLLIETALADRRVKRFRATPRVKSLFARRNREDFAAIAGWLAPIDDAETKQLLSLLLRILGEGASAGLSTGRRAGRRRAPPAQGTKRRARCPLR